MNARRPLALAALALAMPALLGAQATKKAKPATPAKAPAAATTAAAQPTARSVIDAYIKAIGGREAVLARKSFKSTMTMEIPAAGMKADIEAYMMAPNKMYSKTTLPGLGEIQQGYDGTTAWGIDPMQGARVLSGKELDQLVAQADLSAELRDAAKYASQKYVEKADFEGRPAHKLELVRQSGDTIYEFYDAETALLLGSQQTAQTQMGPIQATVLRQDYKPMGGLLMATKQVQRANGQEFVITVVTLETDKVDPTVFELPAAIKALLPAK